MLRALIGITTSETERDDDEGLVAAAREDPARFSTLYERYYPRVYRYLLTRTATPEDAADLTQTAFLNAYRGLPRFRSGSAPFAAWLFRIARNTAIDAQRRRRQAAPWEAVPALPAPALTPEAQVIQSERLNHLRALIASLDREQRELLALRFAGGLSSREIAPLVGKSQSAVKKKLARTMHDLKEAYRDAIEA